jgi:protein tyrosine phosphatase (PTP) superfamily phosphohydrolase (DUF442 family)
MRELILKIRRIDMRYKSLLAMLVLIVFIPTLAWSARPFKWAQPIELAGVPNLYQVSPDLYRSSQPSADGFKNLKTLGIKTVVNLRTFHSDSELLDGTGLDYEHIRMQPWCMSNTGAKKILNIAADNGRTPILIHCQHGADRTGAMCALYRIAFQGWSKQDAIKEMTQGGFGFHEIWSNLPEWIENLDVGEITSPKQLTGQYPGKK